MSDTTDNFFKPTDLAKTGQTIVNKAYLDLPFSNLALFTTYNFQFSYVDLDGNESAPSPVFSVFTATESVPAAPSTSVASTGSLSIPVTLSTFPTNAKRVDVFVTGGQFGSGKVVYSFFSAGIHNIPASAGDYQVQLFTISATGGNGIPTQSYSVTVTDPTINIVPDPSVLPSTPTVSSVLGAIQLAWNGKTSTGGDQPKGFVAAKVYVGTTSNFTPIDTGTTGANQVDVLNFGNGQNILNISVGTLVNGTAMTYNTNYYIKIKTTNGNTAQDSSEVLATGSPVQIGKVGSGDIVTVTADQITAGTIQSQAITIGTSTGKHVKLNSGGDPISIYGTGGTSDPLLTFTTNGAGQSVLSIKGSGTFTGDISAATGTLTNALNLGSYNLSLWGGRGYPFSVNSGGNLEASSGKVGGWTISPVSIYSSLTGNRIALYPQIPQISLISPSNFKILLDDVSGLKFAKISDSEGSVETSIPMQVTPAGDLNLRGTITVGNSTDGSKITMAGGSAGSYIYYGLSNYATISDASTYTYTGTSTSYDPLTGEFITSSTSQSITSARLKITDNTLRGGSPLPSSSTYYGELWLNSTGSGVGNGGGVDLWANYPGGFIGFSLVTNSSEKSIYLTGSGSGFGDYHYGYNSNEVPAMLLTDGQGKMSRGRAIMTGSSNQTSLNNNNIGLNGDLYFSTT